MSKALNSAFFIYIVIMALACSNTTHQTADSPAVSTISDEDTLSLLFKKHKNYLANGFDFPVAPPNGKGYYNAQGFRKNNHLGDDWNGNGGGNTDKGDTIYSIANGYVTTSINYFGGWGKVLRSVHAWEEKSEIKMVESLYAHMDKLLVRKGEWVKKGQPVGTIGDAEGKYLSHLHLEIREVIDMDLGGGYSADTSGYVNPTKFIKAHRKM